MSTATAGWGVSTAIVIGGIGSPNVHDIFMSEFLAGALRDYDQRVSVTWPAEARPYTGADDMTLGDSIRIGTANLNAQIDDALAQLERDEDGNLLEGEEVTVVGLSAGSLVVTETLRGWSLDGEEDPEADEINFVVVADSSRQEIVDESGRYNPTYDYTYQPAPQTPYDTVEVTGEYDGFADFPDRWWNLNAVLNAMAGSTLVHVPMMFADLSEVPKQNTTVTTNALGGTTVRYLVPAERLPLVVANPSLAPREAELRASIDKAYARNDPANVAARLAGPDVPQDILDIVTRESQGGGEVDLATVASLQQAAETEAADEAWDDAPLSLSEQLSAAVSSSTADETDAAQPPSTRSVGTTSVAATDKAASTAETAAPVAPVRSAEADGAAPVAGADRVARTERKSEARSERESRAERKSEARTERKSEARTERKSEARSERSSSDSGRSDAGSSDSAK